jgi:hypothetical protein
MLTPKKNNLFFCWRPLATKKNPASGNNKKSSSWQKKKSSDA